MLKSYKLFLVLIAAIALLVVVGCGPMEETKTTEKGQAVGEEGTPQPPLKKPNELDHWNGVDCFYKNGWVDAAVQVVDDKEAEKGKALVYRGASGVPKMAEYMNRGPYTELQPGKYSVIFRLKVSDVNFPPDKPVYIDVEVTGKATHKRIFIGSRILTGKDFVKDQWSDRYALDVDLKELGTAEIRVKPTIAADTYLDYIALLQR
jgi:hypothetical protein